MPVKIVGDRPADEAAAKLTRQHQLMTATPAEINAYIDDNVTDMASAKKVLKVLAKAVAMQLQGKI